MAKHEVFTKEEIIKILRKAATPSSATALAPIVQELLTKAWEDGYEKGYEFTYNNDDERAD